MITHYRVDMRVVHGQTVTILKKTFPLNGIIVIDDEIEAISNSMSTKKKDSLWDDDTDDFDMDFIDLDD